MITTLSKKVQLTSHYRFYKSLGKTGVSITGELNHKKKFMKTAMKHVSFGKDKIEKLGDKMQKEINNRVVEPVSKYAQDFYSITRIG